ncbi:MAG: hypothetical protein P4L56_02010 [Candidatus Sulfopaludibacter sp.]|nr:hypothetical protein [Candidatus Sulfopaludibacter sp.]
MDYSRSAMQVALRVVKAITEDRAPSPVDLRELRRLLPSVPDLPAAELACGVIHRVVELRAAEARKCLGEGA